MIALDWDVIFAAAHVLMLVACGRLFCTAPDVLQKVVLLIIIVSGLLLFAYYTLRAFELMVKDDFTIVGSILAIEHIGVMLYILRLALVETGVCRKSSRQSLRCQA